MTAPGTVARIGSSMNIWRSLKGLPRDVWILAAATLINRAGTMVLPFLVLYLTTELGFSASRAGFVLGIYGTGALVAAPISGRLTDRIGPLPVMRASLVLASVFIFILPFARSFPAVVTLVFLWAVATDLFRPANLVIVADIVPADRLKQAYALSRLAINLGMSIGPAAAGFIAQKSFTWIFVANGTSTLIAAIVLMLAPFTTSQINSGRHDPTRTRSFLDILAIDDKRMVLFLSAIFLMGVVFFQVDGPLPLFLVQDLSLSPAFYGGLFSLNTLIIVFTEVPLNTATSHWPHRRALALGAMLFAIGSGLWGFASGPPLVVFAMVIWTVGEMMLFPQASAYLAEIAPPSRRGEYMGAYSFAFSLAFAISPWMGTSSYAHFGFRIFWIGVFFVGALSAVLMRLVRSEPQLSPR
ncbi:MAG TPA: MFS transporter [Gemmatimonadaceae bacterium]